MKKLSFCLALFCMAVPSFAQVGENAPKVAVYVAEGALETGELLRTLVLEGLVNSGRYSAIERSEEFLKQLRNEHSKQRSGDVDDAQISRLGRQAGVSFVCVVAAAPGLGEYLLSARMIDVETAKVASIGSAGSPLKGMDDMKKAADEIVGKILRGSARPAESGSSGNRRQSADPAATYESAKVFINTQPPRAAIYIDGKIVGMSNGGARIDVPAGTHRVTFEKDGFNKKTETMTFGPGVNYSVNTVYLSAAKDFTFGERFGAMGLNIVTGAGSGIIMNDWTGSGITYGLVSGGGVIMLVGAANQNEAIVITGLAAALSGYAFGLVRPWIYKKPRPKSAANGDNPYGDVKFAVIPGKNGGLQAAAAYGLSF
jgi:hypothetical protein